MDKLSPNGRSAVARPSKPPLVLIAGPTASGKSALALDLAERHDGVVINADASQVYRDLRVLTARPSPADETRAPHRLFGHVDGADTGYSMGRWADQARAVVAETHAAGKLPILVGGSGLYIRTLIEGIAPVPDIDPAIRAAVRAASVAANHAALMREDRGAADRLHPADTTRIARALEVVRATGRPLSAWQVDRRGGIADAVDLQPLILLPPRGWVEDRAARRADAMIAGGAIEEVEALYARGDVPERAPVMRAIGVPEIAAAFREEKFRYRLIVDLRLATARYAKRQYTWFRHQPPADWPRLRETEAAALRAHVETILREYPVDAQRSSAYRAAPQQGICT